MSRSLPVGLRVSAAGLAVLALALAYPASPGALSSSIVISQVYGGGGNSGATLKNDFIELHNRGDAPVSVDGWTVQYASSTGGTWQRTSLSGVIPAGGYYLVQQAPGTGGTVPLPTPDAAGTIAMGASAGKVALVDNATLLTGTCPAGVVDFVGFGAATNCSETSPTANLSNTTAALRNDRGCAETDNNSLDFAINAPAPRNSASPLNVCRAVIALTIDDVTVAEGNAGTTNATFTVSLTGASAAPVSFDIATADGTASAGADYVAQSLTAQTIPAGSQTYSFTVIVNGDVDVEPTEQFFVNVTNVVGATLADGQGTGTITNDDVAPVVYDVVISQVYGGGGNSGAYYRNDFIELFNRGTAPVDITGWSVQYASGTGTGLWLTDVIEGGVIEPGHYFLIQQAAGSNTGAVALPAPDSSGILALGSSSGKVLLRASCTPVNGVCAIGGDIVDVVGFGNSNCAEGTPASQLSNTLAALRKRGGCYDTNVNSADFSVTSPRPRNSSEPARSCDYSTLAIHDIQGNGTTTPYSNHDVITTGIVTGVKSNGFFLQAPDAAADSDLLTSEGIFVFTGAAPALAAGTDVRVKGTASEYFKLTQIESTLPGDITVNTTGNPLPSPVALTGTILTAQQLERYEGMRMQTGTLTTVSPSDQFGEVFAVLAGVPRPMREPGAPMSLELPPDPITGVVEPGVARWDENPERFVVDTDGLVGSTALPLTSNVTLSGVTGPLEYSYGFYKLLPESAPIASENMKAVAVPAAAANEFTIAGYNIENFVGASTQLAKAALNVRTVMRAPDVIGVIEIGSLSALQSLATRINSDAVAAGEPNPMYEARLIPAPAGGSQHVGFLVKTSRVQINNVWQYAGDVLLPSGAYLHDRPPLVLDATIDPLGTNPGRVLVVVNHLRSFIDVELNDDEGARVRDKRTRQAESLAMLLNELQTGNPATPVVSVGDYNAYEFSDGYTDPISVITGNPTPGDQIVYTGSPDLVDPDFVNLTNTLPAAQRYSFVFEGTPQALDHVIINTVASRYLQRYAIARSNADFPDSEAAGLVKDVTRPEANSDHDQPVAYFAFPGTPVITLAGGATVNVEAYTSFTDPGYSAKDDFGPLPVTVTGSVDVNTPGTYTLTYTATNVYQTTSVIRTVIVADTIAPAITGFAVSPDWLGPANHKMIDVTVAFDVSDASRTPVCGIGVTSNEPVNGVGDGTTIVDWEVVGLHALRLRAERSGRGTSRIYNITVTCTDASGNASTAIGTVLVSHDNR